MKNRLGLILSLFIGTHCFGQLPAPAVIKNLQRKEDSLKNYSVKIIQGINSADRFTADSIFTRMLVRALKEKYSFNYPFDSLQTISRLYAPDSSFRIFTWQMVINDNVVRQHGAIQMRTPDGSLRLYPLIDKSDVTTNITDTIGNHLGWIGAIYYKIILKKNSNQNYYTLLGYDENNIRTNRKIIEVLQFTNDGPVFGGRYFNFEGNSFLKTPLNRYVMEYKKNAGPKLNYDEELDIILVEHLISESGEPQKKWTLVGDGDYEGFKWQNGKWIHIEKIYNYTTPQGQEPVPNPIRDEAGNLNENNLKNNQEEEKPKNSPKTTVPKKKNK